jgi:hypothetical protein
MNPAIVQRRKQYSSNLGAIDWGGVISMIAAGAAQIAQGVTTRQQAEAARTQLQQYYVSAFYSQVAPLAEQCQIRAVDVVNALIGEFEQKCSSIPHAQTAASCGNISSEMRQVWLGHARNWDAACASAGQTPSQNPAQGTGNGQTPVIPPPVIEADSNILPIAIIGIGVVLLLTSRG